MKIINGCLASAGLLTLVAISAPPAYALINPVPMATDARIKTVLYSPNEIIKFTGYYGYQSNIQFGEEETISTISLGDSVPWQLNPVGNRLFLKPIEQEATTNMTVITNKHTYFFELHAEGEMGNKKNISDKNLTFELRIIYPNEDISAGVVGGSAVDHVPDLETEDLNKYNFRYTISGDDDIAPIRIFDDGEFTYFQFHDINGEVPAFYRVDKDGNESIINYRARGPYIVVERVAPRFTLRHGKSVVCVFNEATVAGRHHPLEKKASDQSWWDRWFGGSSNPSATNAAK